MRSALIDTMGSPSQQTMSARARGESNQSAAADKVGRNELCPCGSGKKYKRYHGATA